MHVETTMYHKVLRVSSVVCACVLAFQSGIFSQATAELSQNTGNYLANAVGMSASVAPNELNQYTAALTQKERELAAREAALEERELAIGGQTTANGSSDTTTYLLAGVLFILLVLILLNYTLDFLRATAPEKRQPV